MLFENAGGMASESDCRAFDSDECEIVMNNFIMEQRCRGFTYYHWAKRGAQSFDSDNRIHPSAVGLVPGKQQGEPVKNDAMGLGPVAEQSQRREVTYSQGQWWCSVLAVAFIPHSPSMAT